MQGQCIDEERQEYMESGRTIPKDIDEYIRLFPDDIQALLQSLRQTIREAAPDAEETISYQMPAFKQNGMLVYFAAFKKHIGFYPTSSGIEAFREELSAYEGSKGTVRFPIDKPLPLDLVRDIVKFRVRENLEKQRKRR
jgi:uncharacterized protein YdhG (YjbR/CyaY superfamily)